MLASRAIGVILHTLGKQPGDLTNHQGGDEFDILNEAGTALLTAWPWKYLERTSRPLHIVAGQPWIDLPADFGELIGEPVPAEGLLERFEPASFHDLLDMRTSAVTVDTFTRWYAVENATRDNKNLIASTEVFSDSTVWTPLNGATVTANSSVGPSGKTDADTLTAVGSNNGRVVQDVDTAALLDGAVYVASVYVKAGTATTNDFELSQQGSSPAPETNARVPKTFARITWAAGVPSVALFSSQGIGDHTVGVQAISDGWHRVWVAITFQRQADLPNEEIRFALRPDATGTTGTLLVWGAQLERFEHSAEGDPVAPTVYTTNASPIVLLQGEPVRRLAIYPTPTVTQQSVASIYYRRGWKTISTETEVIDVPTFINPLFLEYCRAAARGAFEEDEAFATDRYDALRQSAHFAQMAEYDQGQQRSYGKMRTAGDFLVRGRDWGSGAHVETP